MWEAFLLQHVISAHTCSCCHGDNARTGHWSSGGHSNPHSHLRVRIPGFKTSGGFGSGCRGPQGKWVLRSGRREFQWWVVFQSMGSGSYCKNTESMLRLGSWLCIRLWVVVHGPPGLRGHVRDRDGRWNWDHVCRVLLQHATQARKSFRDFGGF